MTRQSGFGLGAKLLLLLLAFGVIPLGLSIAVGYTVSRAVIIEQTERTMKELGERQASHLSTELTRQSLLLRTITGQLPVASELGDRPAEQLSGLLSQHLPEDGVFDGLRVVVEGGRVLVNVALGDTAAHWPGETPATDWSASPVFVHREGHHVIGYLIATPIRGGERGVWLEGHVRAEDFARLFGLPPHMAGSIEPAIFERIGEPVLIGHEHARRGLVEAFALRASDAAAVTRASVEGRRSVIATAPIPGSDWFFTAALPLEIALAPLARLRNSALLSFAVLIALIVVIGVLAARSVTTPLRELTAAAHRFGRAGEYKELTRRSSDEVGVLVESFNRMARDLECSRREIERLHEREMERAEQLATVGELASGVAHEIRNPVTGVRGALELVLRKLAANDPSRPLLAEAEKQLERIEDTTTQLLHYARPPELREVVVDANQLVDRAVHVVEVKAKNANIEMTARPAEDTAPVRVDPELMVQVLVNLMLNGIEAMRANGALSLLVDRNEGKVTLMVRDNGPGIPAESRTNIFRPFFTTKHQGTGLGLSISHQIITRHGGTLRVEDTPGGGATFVVTLPLAGGEQDAG